MKCRIVVIILIFFASDFFVSCGGVIMPDVDESRQYVQAHPDCILGLYSNYYTDGIVNTLQLNSDSTYVHKYKKGDNWVLSKGEWGITGYDHSGFVKIELRDWGSSVSEGGEEGIGAFGTIILDCNEIDIND